MALTDIQRARIILDLIKDGDVTTPAAYANVDLATAELCLKWADFVWSRFPGGIAVTPSAPTNAEKAAWFIKQLRRWLESCAVCVRVAAAEKVVQTTETAAALAETQTELGN